jgi:hypothetical protein
MRSVSFTVKLAGPVVVGVVGVPEISPPVLRLKPAGNDPEVIVQV